MSADLFQRIGRIDRNALRAMRSGWHDPALERVALAYTRAGEHGMLWSGLALLGAATGRRRGAWLLAAALPPAAIALNYPLKLAVGRERPRWRRLPPLGRVPRSLSFPSGHAAAAFAGAVAMGRLAPRARPPLLVGAVLMAATRPYLGLHYPGDVLAGAVLGVVVGAALGARPTAVREPDGPSIPWPAEPAQAPFQAEPAEAP